MNQIARQQAVALALTDITLDPDLQPRVRIDTPTFEEYMHAIVDGATLPPVTVFRDGDKHLLADGFHRWHAHKVLELPTIAAVVHRGTLTDALRFALGANADHGKQREPGDYRRAYDRACAHRLIDPIDTAGLKALLRCTTQWAYRLTEAARTEVERKRDAEIATRKAAGQSNRAIARNVGVVEGTVRNVVGAQKVNPLLSTHPASPSPKHPAQVEFDDMTSPRGLRWRAAYNTLVELNKLAAPEALFADRYTRLDHTFGDELRKAHAWIKEMDKRYFHG